MNDKEKIAALRECVEWLSVHLKRDHKCLHMESDRKGIDLWVKQTLAATVPAQSEASERRDAWQPIETAPKDGAEIIVFHPVAGVCAAFCPGEGFAWHCMDGQHPPDDIEEKKQ